MHGGMSWLQKLPDCGNQNIVYLNIHSAARNTMRCDNECMQLFASAPVTRNHDIEGFTQMPVLLCELCCEQELQKTPIKF